MCSHEILIFCLLSLFVRREERKHVEEWNMKRIYEVVAGKWKRSGSSEDRSALAVHVQAAWAEGVKRKVGISVEN